MATRRDLGKAVDGIIAWERGRFSMYDEIYLSAAWWEGFKPGFVCGDHLVRTGLWAAAGYPLFFVWATLMQSVRDVQD